MTNRAVLLKNVRPAPTEPTRRIYFVSPSANEGEMRRVHDRLRAAGAWRINTFYPDLVVCELPVSVDPNSLVTGTGVTARTREAMTSPLPSKRSVIAPIVAAYREMDERARRHPVEPAMIPGLFFGANGGGPADGGVPPTDRAAVAAPQDEDPLMHQNSEFLSGRILINVVLPESKGENSQENWTDDTRNAVAQFLRQSVFYWERYFPNTPLDFDWSFPPPAETEYEPITMRINDVSERGALIDDIMSRMDVKYAGTEDFMTKVHMYNNNQRRIYTAADWVFTVFVVNSANDEDHEFDGAKTSIWAELGGPYVILPYPAGFGAQAFEKWFVHGMSTVFWAMTEDLGGRWWPCESPIQRSGYLNIAHGNQVKEEGPMGLQTACLEPRPTSCIAMFDHVRYYGEDGMPCDYTLGMLGYIDQDRDNVLDIYDAAPEITFYGAAVETLVAMNQPVRFRVDARAVPNRNSQQAGLPQREYVTAIKDVSYELNNAFPIVINPEDGVADEASEDFSVVLEFLLPGSSFIEVTGRNAFGAKSEPKVKEIFYIGLDYFQFRKELQNEGIGLAWDLRGLTFGAQLELWRVDYKADSLVTLVAPSDRLQPIRPTQNGLTPYYFLDRTVTPGSDYGYYVVGNFTVPYRGEDKLFQSVSQMTEVTASVPRDAGILSRPTPNPFLPSSMGDVMVSVAVPGTQGVPLIRSIGGPRRSTAQATGPEPVGLTVYVYDVVGRRVKLLFDEAVFESVVNVRWDGTNSKGEQAPSGVYFIAARVGDTMDSQKVLLIR